MRSRQRGDEQKTLTRLLTLYYTSSPYVFFFKFIFDKSNPYYKTALMFFSPLLLVCLSVSPEIPEESLRGLDNQLALGALSINGDGCRLAGDASTST